MRRGRLVSAIALLILGLIALALTYVNSSSSVAVPQNPNFASFQLNTLGSATVTVHWSGGNASTVVGLYSCGATCDLLGTKLGSGAGSSGSFSAQLSPGKTYLLTENNTTGSVPATLHVTGITLLLVISLILLVGGAVLLYTAVRHRSPTSMAEVEAGPTEASTEPAAAPVAVSPTTPFVTGPPRVVSAPPPVSPAPAPGPPAPSAPAPPGGGRPPIKCSYCGTMNEPWLTNCRWCTRPLASTGSA